MVEPKSKFQPNFIKSELTYLRHQLNSDYPPNLECYVKITEKYKQCESSNMFKPMYYTLECMEEYERDFKTCTVYYHNYIKLLEDKLVKK